MYISHKFLVMYATLEMFLVHTPFCTSYLQSMYSCKVHEAANMFDAMQVNFYEPCFHRIFLSPLLVAQIGNFITKYLQCNIL